MKKAKIHKHNFFLNPPNEMILSSELVTKSIIQPKNIRK